MGVGSSRMNKYTIGVATRVSPIVNIIPGWWDQVAIAHDSRNNSRFLQKQQPMYCCNGIKVYLFETPPTPELSFAIRHRL
jgi:phosphoglucomutase